MKRTTAIILCLLLIFSILPIQVFAIDTIAFNVTGIPSEVTYTANAGYSGGGKNTRKDATNGSFPFTSTYKNKTYYAKSLTFTLPDTENVTLNGVEFGDYKLDLGDEALEFSIDTANIMAMLLPGQVSITCVNANQINCEIFANFINNKTFAFSFVEKPKDPSAANHKATVADTAADFVTTTYYGLDDAGADKWKLQAIAAPDGQEFDYWSAVAADDTEFALTEQKNDNPLSVALTQDVTFTPHFKAMDVSLLDKFKLTELYVGADPSSGQVEPALIQNQVPVLASKLITDSSCIAYVTFSLPSNLPENDTAKFVLRLYAGASIDESKALGRAEFVASKIHAGNHYFQLQLNNIPVDLSQITAAVDFTSNAGKRELQTRTYDLPATILSTRKSNALRYVENTTGYVTMATAGVDNVTGHLNLVMSDGSGLFTLEKGNLSFTSCDVSGLHQLSQVKALATAGDGTVWAYIASEDKQDLPAPSDGCAYNDSYTYTVGYLASYDGETWALLSDSKVYDLNENGTEATCYAADLGALIPLENGVVVAKDKTWTGSEWTDGGHGKDKLIQMDGKTYAADSNGVYVYDANNRTWQTLTTEVTAGQYDQLSAANGIVAISTNIHSDTIREYTKITLLDVQTKEISEISTEIFGTGGAVFSVINSTGISYDGTPYYYYSGAIYNNNTDRMAVLCRYEDEGEDAQWIHVKEAAFWADDENPNQFETKVRPAGINLSMNPISGVTLHGSTRQGGGVSGSLYLETGEVTITFDANGGTLNGASTLTGKIYDEIPVSFQTTAARAGYIFDGWSYDTEGTTTWDKNNTVFPAKDITLYAKWKDASSADDPLEYHRQSALESLKRQYEKYSKTDYSEANWAKLEQAYQDGIKAINEATVAEGNYPENNVIAALNAALQAMGAITPDRAGKIDVVVSMDAQTLGLGYFIKPTLVTIDKYTQASIVITDMIIDACKEQYDPDFDWQGYQTYHESEPEGTYAYMRTGTVTNSFYLAQVYWPNQEKAQVPAYITDKSGPIDYEQYTAGRYLGEFDYHNMSGWMYSISNINDEELPSFPGVGAADWRMSDGEVMRWQFTVWGYGADLNADNSAWGQASITGNSGDKTKLTVMVAELRSIYGDDLLETNETYVDIFDNVLCNPLATQEALNAAVAKRDQIEDELADAYAAKAVKQLIEDIGLPQNVTLQSKPAIDAARNAYNALTNDQQVLFEKKYPDALSELEAAEARYAELVAEAEQAEIDRAAADGVIELINAIGGVDSVTRSSGPAIRKARNAYDALTDAQKALVTNYDELVACEKAFAEIPDPVLPPVTPSKPSTTTPTAPAETVSYIDVAKSDWFYDSVLYVSEKGLMTGTGANSFSPNVSTTRGMIVTILARLEGVDTTKGGSWYEAGQKWAMENGISDGTNMTGEMTREQLATILYRYAQFKGYDVSKSNSLSRFTDSGKVSDWAQAAMQWANAEGLINGKGGGLLDPQGKATRAETAAILMRFMKNVGCI